jgi:molybdenum cofactor guanylyltransferase
MPISTIVLAGGLSLRMGQDKALLEIAGVPLLRRITDLVVPLSRSILVPTRWLRARFDHRGNGLGVAAVL